MLFILEGTPGSYVSSFLARLKEETINGSIIMLYEDWVSHKNDLHCDDHEHHPNGIIFLRVKPEIAYKRLQNDRSAISLDEIQQKYTGKEDFFIHNKSNHQQLQHLPILILNGNIDFQTDFSQFYNHLFYIRRFINDIKKQQEIAQGTYQEKSLRKCC